MAAQQCPHCSGTYKRLSQHIATSTCAFAYQHHDKTAEQATTQSSIHATHIKHCNTNIKHCITSDKFAMDSNFFERNFTPEEFLMIKLTSLCDRANVPLHLVDSIVDVFQEAAAIGLNLTANHIRTRQYFIQHLSRRFVTPTPHTIMVPIEALDQGNDTSTTLMESIPLIRYDFLDQAKDLINDHELWGDLDNFDGTINCNPDYYFSTKPTSKNNMMVDEVVSGKWYCKTYKTCSKIAGTEKFLILGVICYCDKTGTDVNQRNSLEPLSFTFTIFNRKCRYRTSSWRLLGYLPDFDIKSKASKSIGRSSSVGRRQATRNYHRCLEQLL